MAKIYDFHICELLDLERRKQKVLHKESQIIQLLTDKKSNIKELK